MFQHLKIFTKICLFQKMEKILNKVGVVEEIAWENDRVLNKIGKVPKNRTMAWLSTSLSNRFNNYFLVRKKVLSWMDGWVGGIKAVLKIAYSNQQGRWC